MTWTRRILLSGCAAALSMTALAGGANAEAPTVTGPYGSGAGMRVAAATRHPVNFAKVCPNQYPGQGLFAVPFTSSPLSWACTNGARTVKKSIDVHRACLVQYPGHPTQKALYFNANNPYSWSCVF
jgi:hypothetical protein